MSQKTILDITAMKGQTPIAMLTAYDFPTAAILDESGIDMLLVGDSLGNVIYGMKNTLPVTLDMIIGHARAVVLATKNALVIGDLPFGSYQVSTEQGVESALRLMAESGVQAVKLEGGQAVVPIIKKLTDHGVPVMAHVGLTPQSVHQLGGFKMQGKTPETAKKIMDDAKAVEQAGAFSVVLECVDSPVARDITQTLRIPTIGIGAGKDCDGQVLVTHDLLGYTVSPVPKFVEQEINLRTIMGEAVKSYIQKTKSRT